jgi:hypothetical protein
VNINGFFFDGFMRVALRVALVGSLQVESSSPSSVQITEPAEGGASAVSAAFLVAASTAKSLPLNFHSVDLVRINKRCVPNIITEVFHPNRSLVLKRSGYHEFLG